MTILAEGRLVLVGAGKMGGAMLEGWLARGLAARQVVVLEPAPDDALLARSGETGLALNPDIDTIGDARVVVLAVKPQVMEEVVPGLRQLVKSSPVFLSIAAGRTVASLARHFGAGAAIVRAIPNTPAAIGRGISVAFANRSVSAAQRGLCQTVLEAVGKAEWVDDEALIDAATAVSGSGPAYVFHLTECMAKAGEGVGLPPDLAMTIARETVSGAGELLRRCALPAATLRENVTSPAGTTAAALKVLRDGGRMEALMAEAIAAAERRSRELSQ